MAHALRVQPVNSALLVGIGNVPGKGFYRCRSGCRPCRDAGAPDLRSSRSSKIGADDRSFAGPFFGRLVPQQRDQQGGDDDFNQETHERRKSEVRGSPRRIRPLADRSRRSDGRLSSSRQKSNDFSSQGRLLPRRPFLDCRIGFIPVASSAVQPFKAFLPAKRRNRRLNDVFFPVIMTSNSR